MRYLALATDYDGTIAQEGRVDAPTLAALERAKAAGLRLILVTGRVLPELEKVYSRLDLFDLAVLENGAVLFNPATQHTRRLADQPPNFADELHARGVSPISTGQVIVATYTRHEATVQEVIRALGLDVRMILNKGALMVLPAGVDKGTGLAAALAELGLAAEQVVGVGDAENDHALFAACGCGVAVGNALDELKAAAHVVTKGKRGAGVVELIDKMLVDELDVR